MEIMTYSKKALSKGEVALNTNLHVQSYFKIPKAEVITKEPYVSYEVGRSAELLPAINIKKYLVKLSLTKSLIQKSNVYYFIRRRKRLLKKLEVVA